jgi:hypothetical protein
MSPHYRFRVWHPTEGPFYCDLRDPSVAFHSADRRTLWLPREDANISPLTERIVSEPQPPVIEQDTGLVDAVTSQPVYEGDIISFTIRGATHGREPDHQPNAQVWWCAEDACWAFGRWTQTFKLGRGLDNALGGEHRFDWWYTVQDDGFDRSTLRILGNVHEHAALLTSHPIIT